MPKDTSSADPAELAAILRRNGYEPVPIKPGTKQPSVNGWQRGGIKDSAWSPESGIGVACGHGDLIGVDIDTGLAHIHKAIEAVLRPDSPRKRGRTGQTILCRAPLEVGKKWPVDVGEKDGKWATFKVEVLTTGQQTVLPPTRHPNTGQPYQWVTGPDGVLRSLYDTPREQLPRVEGDVAAILEAALAEHILPKQLIDACSRVANAIIGTRNDTLNKEVFKLGTGGVDVRLDVAVRCFTAAASFAGLEPPEIRATIESAISGAAEAGATFTASNGPTVRVSGGSYAINATEAEAHLIRAGAEIYQRGGNLVRPVVDAVPAANQQTTRTVALRQVVEPYVVDLFCEHMDWEKWYERDGYYRRIHPPLQVARILLARSGRWKFLPLTGIITTPTIRPDGSLLITPGYDKSTGLYLFDPPQMPEMPDEPSMHNAIDAVEELKDLIREYPFVDEPDRSVALSALITPVVRAGMSVVPMHAITAPTSGSGKSHLVDTASLIFSGMPCPVISQGESPGELEKRLNSSLIAGHPLISIDNLNGALRGDYLCQAIERPLIDIRILGKSEHVRIANNVTIFATGNNLEIHDDLVRRTLVCRLDARVERPENRTFEADPAAMVLRDRGRYIVAALTIVLAYLRSDRAQVTNRTAVAGFLDWSRLVRDALMWLDCADPALTMNVARESDPGLEKLRSILLAMSKHIGCGKDKAVTAKRLLELARSKRGPLDDAITELREDGGLVDSVWLGQWLRRNKGRVVDNLQLRQQARGHHGSEWYVVQLADGGLGGSGSFF